MEWTVNIKKLLLVVAIVVFGLFAALMLAPTPNSHGGPEHDHSLIEQALANASCTHTQNTHYHDSGRIKHITDYGGSHREGGEHHHTGKLKVITSALAYTINYERKCPAH